MKWDGSIQKVEREICLNQIITWIFLILILSAVIWGMIGCTSLTNDMPTNPVNLSPPITTRAVDTQSFWTDLFGWPDATGLWGGWLNTQYAIPVQLQLQYFTDYQGNQVLGGWVIYVERQLTYTINRAYTQGHFFWLVYYSPTGWTAIVAITDWGYRYTTNCGLFSWNPLIRVWDLISACWFNR